MLIKVYVRDRTEYIKNEEVRVEYRITYRRKDEMPQVWRKGML